MEFKKREPIIILICGKARSGKNSLASYLEEYFSKAGKKVIISPYTKYLKYYIEQINGQKINDDNKPRDLLQQISSKIIKGDLKNNNFFINRQIEDIDIYSYFADVILIPDVRFPNEINEIKKKYKYVVSIGITRKNYISNLTKEQLNDITETALDNYHDYDYEIENNNLNSLKNQAIQLVDKIIYERKDKDE